MVTTTVGPGCCDQVGGTAEESSHSASLPRSSARTVPRAIRSTTSVTWIESVMWWMKARKSPTLASTSAKASVTDSCGTNGLSPARTSRSTMRAKTKEAVKTPRVTCTTRLPRKLPSSRGVNWLLASCMTTMVIEKTRPVTEIIALAMVLRRLRAESALPLKR